VKPAPFEYHRAVDLDDAVVQLGSVDDAKAIAGGQSLVSLMNLRLARPELLVDLNGLRDLDYIESTADGGLVIGAMTRQRSLEQSALVRERCPLMFEAVPMIAHAVIRNRGTIGGSLAHADPASELCTVALAVDARLRVRGASGEREIPAVDFFLGPLTSALEEDEVLTEIVVPPSPTRSGSAFDEVSRRKGDFALAGVGAVVGLADDGTVAHARVACTSLGPTALRATTVEDFLVGERPDLETLARASELVDSDIRPNDSLHGSAAYRLRIARALTRRVLSSAVERAT
jgi:carbon-monoxide dehydrogenase medium subunit